MPPIIYLDNNATTPMAPEVAELITELSRQSPRNPASQHRAGRQALAMIESAKSEILQLVGASCQGMNTAQIILTSGGTESNNLALYGFSRQRPGLVIVGETEHASLLDGARHWLGTMQVNETDRAANRLRLLPVDRQGRYDLAQLQQWLETIYSGRDPTFRSVALVSLMCGNNETGVTQDLQPICELCRAYGVPVHSDAVQAVGKVPFSMTQLGLSSLSVTAHKIHGPVGIGALIVDQQLTIKPLLVGGGHQLELRAGTEPVMLALALAAALRLSNEAQRSGVYQQVERLRDDFERRLQQIGEVQLIADAPRLPHTSNVAFPGLDRQVLQMSLDLEGLACSTGSACASGSSRPSHVLSAMGLAESIIGSSLRFSLSRYTSSSEIDSAIDIVQRVTGRLRERQASKANVGKAAPQPSRTEDLAP